MRLTKFQRKKYVQSTADRIIKHLKIELPDIDHEISYSSRSSVSRYLILKLGEKEIVARISDHESARQGFDLTILVRYDEPCRICSAVMQIVERLMEGNSDPETV